MMFYLEKVWKWYIFYFDAIEVYYKIIILLLTICVGIGLAILIRKNKISCFRAVVMELLFCYLLFVLMSTVFARESVDMSQANIDIIDTYRHKLKYNIDTQYELLLNILLLLPFGNVFPYLVKRNKFQLTLISGLSLSVIIEGLQFILKKGTLELTDIVNNSLGVLLGFSIYILFRRCWRVMRKTRNKKENYHVQRKNFINHRWYRFIW